jgi:hypothetical protein
MDGANDKARHHGSRGRGATRIVYGVSLGLLVSCSGKISALGGSDSESTSGSGRPGDPSHFGGGAGATTGSGGGSGPTSGRDPDEAGYGDDPSGLSDLPAPAARAPRLTHLQWQNSVRDLFALEDASGFASDFRADPVQGGFVFDNDGATLSVDGALWGSYQRAASDISAFVLGDDTRLAALLPPGIEEDEDGARAFITSFGARAHRRPLSESEVEEYLTLYRAAAGTYGELSAFRSGIRLLIEAFLQSPHFIYRLETSREQVGNVIQLDDYEIASRLSYMIWNSMPDQTLFDAAASGELSRASEAAAQAARMLADPRAEDVVASFHEQLLDYDRYRQISPAPIVFPDAPPNLADLAWRESDLFVRSLFQDEGGFTDLMTSSRTFVNSELAGLYGISGPAGGEFGPVTLPESERRGYLTQIGFLASHATSRNPDPIHRGVFVAKRILCSRINAPPDDIPPLPVPEGQTNRQTVEDHTEDPETICATCHSTVINPLGFPFENYDALGSFRTMDNGLPVDASTQPLIDGAPTPVSNAIDLATAIAESSQAHECYTRYWVEFAYGRAFVDGDRNLVQRLGGESRTQGLSVKDLIVGLVRTEAFMTRSTEELP